MFDPSILMNYLLGTWNCSFQMGDQRLAYTAKYARGFAKPWLRQTDAWHGGGGDEGFYSYDPGVKRWAVVIMEKTGETTILSSNPSDDAHIVYKSVYPDASMTEVFQRVSGSRYTLSFSQTKGGKTTNSRDVCTKTGP